MPRFPLKKRVFLCFPALSRVIPHFSNILSLYNVSLVLPYGDIQSVELEDAMLNTVITIQTKSDTIRLTTQQAELSDLRSSGIYASIYSGFFKNWHKENLDGTLAELKGLGSC